MRRTASGLIRSGLLLTLAILICPAPAWASLGPDDLLLVVNSRISASRSLAEFYAKQRRIPAGRIVELDIPPLGISIPPEEIPFDSYEQSVAQPIRDFLVKSQLQSSVKCIVTFWGVPLRIGRRALNSQEQSELEALKRELDQDCSAIATQIAAIENSARELNPQFVPGAGSEVQQLVARVQAAMNSIVRSLPTIQDSASRNARFLEVTSSMESLLGSARTVQILAQPALARFAPRPPTASDLAEAQASLGKTERELAEAQGYQPDLASRQKVRALARKPFGSLGSASILSAQIDSFRVEESESALDSELALLWWHAYPRSRWVPNPMNWRVGAQPGGASPPVIMVTRIDGPSELIVRKLITTTLQTEEKGLEGQVVLDARGKPATDTYGQYDQLLRNLNALLSQRTSLKITFDDTDALIPAHSLKDPIALYCGWYSLRNYAPPGPFATGAVGFHVASFELVSLHARNEHGWVHGLLSDGVCGTIGPVAEPYLQSFPAADEFFPLLLTGKLTLAEVYWRTVPMVSWMQDCVGDPLYNPYKKNPPLKVEDLPTPLQRLFASTRPQTFPSVR